LKKTSDKTGKIKRMWGNKKMTGLIIKSKIRETVKQLDNDKQITSVADEVEAELERKVEGMLKKGIERAKANQRKTLLARDL